MSSSSAHEVLFSLLPEARTPWREFLLSSGMQALAVAFLVWLRLLIPASAAPADRVPHLVVLVSTPTPVNHSPQPVVKLQSPPEIATLDPINELRSPAAQPKVAKVEDTPTPEVKLQPAKLDAAPVASAPVMPRQGVKTNVFSTGSSATPTIARAPSQVQTGGFGDPNGIAAKNTSGRPGNIAPVGSFDLPSGPGYGNGTGGAKGVAGAVASSGFGNGVALPYNPRPRGLVQSSGFTSADVPAQPTVNLRPKAEPAVKTLPAEIISKPTPVYTQEARNLRIEGEVLLEVVLEASGNLRVLRVVRGLGHGLDDNAVKAAGQIRFKPATKDSQPIDSTVVLHIIFQLA